MTQPNRIWRSALVLAVWGGSGFWVTNLAISLTPIAAEYRAALSIPYLPMLLEALLGGLIIGLGVGYSLLRFYNTIPFRNPVLKSLALSLITLTLVTLLIEVPAKLLIPTSDALRYFLIGIVFNGLRILALGTVIGLQCGRLNATGTTAQQPWPTHQAKGPV